MDFYHIVAIGSGFATSFFLQEYLARAAPNARILMLERSPQIPHATRIERRIFGGYADESLVRRIGDKEKQWSFSIGFGGSSNCWWAVRPGCIRAIFVSAPYTVSGATGRSWNRTSWTSS
jgi:hypothetical protein